MRLIVMDLDYTLLNNHHLLSDEQIPWLKKLAAENTLVLASGRPLPSMLPLVERMGPGTIDWVISDNGAHIVDTQGRCLYETWLPVEEMIRLVSCAMERGVHPHYYDHGVIRAFYRSPFVERDALVTGLPVEVEPDPEKNLWGRQVRKAIVMGEPGRMRDFFEEIREWPALGPILSKPYFMEVPPRGVDKGEALKLLSDHLGGDVSQIIAVGDSLNDVGMVRFAGLGLAMENASLGLKEVADRVLYLDNDQILARWLWDYTQKPCQLDEMSYRWRREL